MDIQKEKEAFEKALINQNNVSISNLHMCTIFDDEKNEYSPSDVCDPKEDFIVAWINATWSVWQAAKAQVPEGFGDIQSWIAVNSFSALDASIVDFPVVDANELAEFIDALNIDVAVPEGFVLVPKLLSDELADELASNAFNNIQNMFDYQHRGSTATHREQIRLRWCKNKARKFQENYKIVIEAQEQKG